jgi:hypothetical protein
VDGSQPSVRVDEIRENWLRFLWLIPFLREESNVTEGSDKTKDSRDEHPLIAIGRDGMPVGKLIGLKLLEAGDGRAVVTLEAGPQHTNPMGTLHGGILCDIADAAMGIAFNTHWQ